MHHGYVRLSVEPLARGAGRDVVFGMDATGWPAVLLDAAA